MIEVRGLTRRYGALTAVHDLSFEVRPGEAGELSGDTTEEHAGTVQRPTRAAGGGNAGGGR